MIKFIANDPTLAPFTLHPLTCQGTFELNGSWSISLELLKDDPACQYMQIDSTIIVDLPWAKSQNYLVYEIYTDEDTVKVQAVPEWVWRATNQYVVNDTRPTGLNGLQALLYVINAAGSDLKAESNIEVRHTAYYINKNLMECISGEENSFLNVWGGEILYDNDTIKINKRAGKSRGLRVSTGFNIQGWSITEDVQGYADIIHPMPYNSQISPITVERETIGRIPHHKFIKYDTIRWDYDCSEEDLTDKTLTICKTQKEMNKALKEAVDEDIKKGAFDPVYTYEIDFIDLAKTDKYREYKDLLYLQLGDTVEVENLNRNISTTQKVVSISYDFLTEEITGITLGSILNDYFRATESTLQKAEQNNNLLSETMDSTNRTIIASKVKGYLLAANTQLKAQYNSTTNTNQTALICENNDINSPTFGCLAYGTAGIQLSKRKLEDGTWDFSTAITSEGIIADYIITGLLTDKTGNFYFNLETGEFALGNGVFKGEIDTYKNVNVGQDLVLGTTSTGRTSKGRIRAGNEANENRGSCIGIADDISNKNLLTLTPIMEDSEKCYFLTGYDNNTQTSIIENRTDEIIFNTSKIATTQDKGDATVYTGKTYTGTLTDKTVKIVNGLVVSIT